MSSCAPAARPGASSSGATLVDPLDRIPAVEWRARPTMSMMTCLDRLVAVDGYLVRNYTGMSGYNVRYDGTILYWFSTQTRNGLHARGMIDDQGRITELGLQARERFRQ